jgi:putative endopeptidase
MKISPLSIRRLPVLATLAALAAAPTVAQTAPDGSVRPAGVASSALGVDTANFDRSVRPQDDFFRFVNGGWLARTEIPGDRGRYGAFDELRERSEEAVQSLVQELVRSPERRVAGSDAQKVADFYEAYLDVAGIERLGLRPLAAELHHIAALRAHAQLPGAFAHLQRIGVQTPIGAGVGQDQKDAERYVATIGQSGLGLPNRTYYFDAPFASAREAYVRYLETLLRHAGDPDPAAGARAVMALETALAERHWTPEASRNRDATYNAFEWSELARLGDFAWADHLQAFGVGASPIVVVRQPDYFQALSEIVAATPMETWRRYLTANLLHSYADVLPSALGAARFEFTGRSLQGLEVERARDLRATAAVEGALRDVVGRLYVERHFDPVARERMQVLVSNIMEAFRLGIDRLEWMGEETRREAHAKLAAFNVKIGYPDTWRDYAGLEVRSGDALGNAMRARLFGHAYMAGRLGAPVDRDVWGMSPQTVNAYYSPSLNEIVFPAAILQPPFFDVNADDAVNYGAIGGVIGHEISHGFDDQGRRSDGAGNLRDWWTAEDAGRFEALGERLAAQYSAQEPLPGMFLNGKLGLGENIGDLSGLAVAYAAYRISLGGEEAPIIDGFTGDQRFFLGWGQIWRTLFREESLRQQIARGPHSPGEFRVRVPLSNIDAFHEAFGVVEGDGMYRAPGERVKIW